jgi:glycosidase
LSKLIDNALLPGQQGNAVNSLACLDSTIENPWHRCPNLRRTCPDLHGVATRIPYLRELGVTNLHLLPFLRRRAGQSDGGFAVADFEQVDPRLGDTADLEALAGKLRAAGISLCSDLILNQVADDHPWRKPPARASRN